MNPLKLTLEGFAGISAGRKRDSITIELPGLEAGPLVALVGPNGAGKSTIMDNLHPYRIMPSRSSSYSPNAFSFYEQLDADEGLKELIWEHAGSVYRSLLKFQSGKRRKTEAYLFVQDSEGEWQPAKHLQDSIESDGKTETYDKVLESILGSPETFFTSVFSAQGRKPLSTYGNAEIKELMAELLGLESIKDLGRKATQVRSVLKTELSRRQEALGQAQMAKNSYDQELAQSATIEGDIANLQTEKVDTNRQLREAERALAEIVAQIQQSENARARKTSLEQTLANLEERIRKVQYQQEQRQQQLTEAHSRDSVSLSYEMSVLQKAIKTANEELAAVQQLRQRGDEIRNAVARDQEINEQTEKLRSELVSREAVLAERLAKSRALQDEVMNESRDLNQMKSSGENLAREKSDAERQSSLTQEVPCACTEMATRCSLLADARAASSKIEPITIKLSTLREKYRAAKDALEKKRADLEILSAEDPEFVQLKNQMNGLQKESSELRPLVMQSANLEQAGKQEQQWAETVKTKTEELNGKVEKKSALDKQFKEALESTASEVAEETKSLGIEVERVTGEIAQIVLPDTQSQVSQEALCKTLSDKLEGMETNIQELQQRLIEAKAKAQSLSNAVASIHDTELQVAKLSEEIGFWNLLIKALGNDGIIALSIDDVGPTLSSYANDLLMACYGPRFTISIQTQTANAKGEDREGFDIAVFDAETEGSKSVEKMSGGERVWINEAMTRAIALFLSKESGQQYATLFTDEADGALDPDRKRRFMHMKREVLKLGGYTREYFVSQTPELWEMADFILDVSKL